MRWDAHTLAVVLPLVLSSATAVLAQPNVEARPLPERAPLGNAPRFTTLSPEQTGVTFIDRYDDPRMWGERYEAFAFGSIGTGVAIGDYDNDGRPDLYLAGRSVRGRLYRNLGDWRFEDVTDAAGLAKTKPEWEVGTAFADVDGDGDLDLYVCRWGAANLLYVNQGNGRFVEGAAAAELALSDASVMAAFADYDRDGRLDVFVQTNLLDIQNAPRGQRDRLYRNVGDGKFEEVTETARLFGTTQGHSAIWWDPDEDGWPDLYVGNDFAAPDQLYLNRRDGSFVNVLDAVASYSPYFAMGMDVGDVNNDGRLDLLVADMLPTSRTQFVSGMLNMQAKTAVPIPAPGAAQYMRNVLYLNTGTPRFQEAAVLAGISATDWTWSVRFEDLDEDGRVDLHVTNGMIRNFMDADFLARVNQVETADRSRLVRAAPELQEKNLAFRNLGDLRFEPAGAAWGLDHNGISLAAAFGDLDGDGDLDLVFSNYNQAATVCRNDSANTHRVIIALRGIASNRQGIGARLRLETPSGVQVRSIASARGYLSTSESVAHFGLGGEAKIDRLTIQWPSGRVQVIEQLAADHRYTITEPEAEGPSAPAREAPLFQDISGQAGLSVVMSERPIDEFTQQPLLPARQHGLGPSLATGDLNDDGLDDVIIGGVAGQGRQVLLQDGPNHVPAETPAAGDDVKAPDAAMLVFEADGDGQLDLLITKGGVNLPSGDPGYQPRLWLGRGKARLVVAATDTLPSFPHSAGAAVAADFDRDGRLDVFVGGRVVPGDYGASPRSALWRNEGGRFVDVTEKMAPALGAAGRVQAALWSDVDQDGWVDLLLATQWGGIRGWKNEQGQRLTEHTMEWGFAAAGSGGWNSLAAADFNGDGKIDYAVGNLGLNTRYRATPDQPVVLFAGSFGPGGRKQLIECETVGGRLMPIRARDSVLSAMPSLRTRAPSYRAYAEASVEELFGKDRLSAAQRFEITQLQSGVFLSSATTGGAPLVFTPLPRVAQIAPIFGMVAGDFDGDGHADLYAVQNFHAPHPEIGRFSGGISQLLRGDGQGAFTAVEPSQSGLVVSGEARALAVKDFNLDGWPDFVVSRQEAPTLAFLNLTRPGRRFVSLRLKGPAGNPTAVGSTVSLVLRGGKRQTTEVYAGSGYVSQSTPTLFFGFEDTDPPREIRVTWPTGQTSVHRYPAGAESLQLKMPRS